MKSFKTQFNDFHRSNRNNNKNNSSQKRSNSAPVEENIIQIEKSPEILSQMLLNNQLEQILNSTRINRPSVFSLLNSFNQFVELCDNGKILKDFFILLFHSNFINNSIEPITKELLLSSPSEAEIKLLVLFLTKCMRFMPNKFLDKMALIYPAVMFAINQFPESTVRSMSNQFSSAFETCKANVRKPDYSFQTERHSSSNSTDFRLLPVIPGSDDIFCTNDDVILKRNKVSFDTNDVAYESVDDYLETQFRLLREDFIRPLRQSIFEIRDNMFSDCLSTKRLDVRIYNNVSIEELLPIRKGVVYKVHFDITKLKGVDWMKARRFIHGSLLCFTNNFFDSIFFASVIESNPNDLRKGNVMVQFDEDPIKEILDNNDFLMLETKNLFEAYKHVLSKLQSFVCHDLPFSNFIAFAKSQVKTPDFMNHQDLYNIECLTDDKMDESQLDAFKNSLKSDLSLIQGPPGTGKTYVGVKIIKYLSKMFQTNNRNIGPILVVCYTNHALDQFLEEIIGELGVENIVRVGGRSKMELLQQCNIVKLRQKWIARKAFPRYLHKMGVLKRIDIETAEKCLVEKYIEITNVDEKLLPLPRLQNYMNWEQQTYFRENDFDAWLKGSDIILSDILNDRYFLKDVIINDCYNNLFEEYISVVLYEIAEENIYNSNNDEEIEDLERFLYEQRFLDEDFSAMNQSKKYKRYYNGQKINIEREKPAAANTFKSVANIKLIKRRLRKIEPITEDEYKNIRSLNVDFYQRLKIYKYWCGKYRDGLITDYLSLRQHYDKVHAERQNINNEEDIHILKSIKIIGMTTTGAARYGAILDKIGCKIVVIEEAAEVLEAHVVSSLSKHCQQLIMIGDHKQLRPKVDVYELEKDYNLGISLFERLVTNECPYRTLKYQHRMRPEISKAVSSIYPDLQDDSCVYTYDPVAGMKTNVYFFNHTCHESDYMETSYKNDFEADFLVQFCEYLINAGNLPSSITILTFYTGQLYNLSNKMRTQKLKGVRICVIDNFQGEENDIILFSLVRSNSEGIVGFVSSPNRLCVALSRAKRGLYVIGNISMLCRKIELFKTVIEHYSDRGNVGSKLPLKCIQHPDSMDYLITDIGDFKNSGCKATCGYELPCGHSCTKVCHRNNPSHKTYRCEVKCHKQCIRGLHSKEVPCYSDFICEEKTEIILSCQHKTVIKCFIDTGVFKCKMPCFRVLNCGHTCGNLCYLKCKCYENVEMDLPCGHRKVCLCGTNVSQISCKEMVNVSFSCGHEMYIECSRKPKKCPQKVKVPLKCSHIHETLCGDRNDPAVCKEKITIQLPCGHSSNTICSNRDISIVCKAKCSMELDCNHRCKGNCAECFNQKLHVPCRERCNKDMACGHICRMSCHIGNCPSCTETCSPSCIHVKCNLKCFEFCTSKGCYLMCKKDILCHVCGKRKPCPYLCGVKCSTKCLECLSITLDVSNETIMDPCNCIVRKSELNPQVITIDNKLTLLCQKCHSELSKPYRGLILIRYKQLFQNTLKQFSTEFKFKWKTLSANLNTNNLPTSDFHKFKEILEKNVSEDEVLRLENAVKCYSDVLDLYTKCQNATFNSKLETYKNAINDSINKVIKWLDISSRQYSALDLKCFQHEMNRLNLIFDVSQLLNTATTAEYALIFQDSQKLLEYLNNILTCNFTEALKTFEEIKKRLKNHGTASEDEEELVQKILGAKDIYAAFKKSELSINEKLKFLKELIRKCHPDKNKSNKANAAVQKVNAERVKLNKDSAF